MLGLVSAILTMGSLTAAKPDPDLPPPPPREFRGAWVATVHNIDWPSRPGLSSNAQKRELLALFDNAARNRLNAIVFQVRPACDALYRSEIEPWSPFLSGTMGDGPDYDPLEFAISSAHARGLELHAWFNPFRALATNRFPHREIPCGNNPPRNDPELWHTTLARPR